VWIVALWRRRRGLRVEALRRALCFEGGRGEEDKSGRRVWRGPMGEKRISLGGEIFRLEGFWAHLLVIVGWAGWSVGAHVSLAQSLAGGGV
jgi:hypothetical protein